MERKLIQEKEGEQKLEAGENRGHPPGSSQHSLDKHITFEEAQLPAINKGFITYSKYILTRQLIHFIFVFLFFGQHFCIFQAFQWATTQDILLFHIFQI